MARRILLVEDETITLTLLSAYLDKAGYRVRGVTTAAEAMASFELERPDLVLLDLALPDEDGLVVLRKIRTTSAVPVVLLSARAENAQRTAALELGANDFITKGVDPQELLLRLRNILGQSSSMPVHASADAQDGEAAGHVLFSGWALDIDKGELIDPDGQTVRLTRAELQLMAALAKNPGAAVRRETLLDAVSSTESGPTERGLDTYVSRLRKKLKHAPNQPEVLQTVKGIGYRLLRGGN